MSLGLEDALRKGTLLSILGRGDFTSGKAPEGAEGAVHLPDHERIAGAKHLQGQFEAGPDFGHGGDPLIFKDAHAARAFERIALKVEMLFVRADPRIADNRQIPLPPVPLPLVKSPRPRIDKRVPFLSASSRLSAYPLRRSPKARFAPDCDRAHGAQIPIRSFPPNLHKRDPSDLSTAIRSGQAP